MEQNVSLLKYIVCTMNTAQSSETSFWQANKVTEKNSNAEQR